jgi:cytoskeleton protein RodZ
VLHERKSRFAGVGSKLSRAASEGDVAPMAPRVGADLRAARERLAWSIQDIADGLRIRGQYLVALEEGRVDELPGTAYAVGFLRT